MDKSKGIGVAGCCVTGREESVAASPGSLSGGERRARAGAGLGFLALGAGLVWGGFALEALAAGGLAILLCAVPCALAAVAGWFGLSHLVASVTGYKGCPELGAIPSLFRRHPIDTRCAPWDNLDRRLP